MLYLLGTGLYYLSDMPVRALNIIRKCERVLLERYTNTNDISYLAELEKLCGKKIEVIGRENVENDSLVAMSKESDVALLVPGDPLFATTHVTLVADCKKKGIEYEIVHASSILTAVAETGLSLYRFGAVCSIPLYSKGFEPESFFDVIEKNLHEGFHSLVLLEAKTDNEFVGIEDAVRILKEIEKKRAPVGINWGEVMCVSSMGSKSQDMFFVSSERKIEKPPLALIIPAGFNEIEKENVRLLLS